ncbi:MAG TPA: hypothetical protein VFV58_13825 [Blastocatellia bacterium]|nr:hypothetical protein [Blastocatellia bacterium]
MQSLAKHCLPVARRADQPVRSVSARLAMAQIVAPRHARLANQHYNGARQF